MWKTRIAGNGRVKRRRAGKGIFRQKKEQGEREANEGRKMGGQLNQFRLRLKKGKRETESEGNSSRKIEELVQIVEQSWPKKAER